MNNDNLRLWVVGQCKLNKNNMGWDFQGVFDSEKKAIKACKNENYFIGKALLNKTLPDDEREWDGAYYPKRRKENDGN